MRALWSTREMPQREAVRLGYAYVAMGTNQESIAQGQELFAMQFHSRKSRDARFPL